MNPLLILVALASVVTVGAAGGYLWATFEGRRQVGAVRLTLLGGLATVAIMVRKLGAVWPIVLATLVVLAVVAMLSRWFFTRATQRRGAVRRHLGIGEYVEIGSVWGHLPDSPLPGVVDIIADRHALWFVPGRTGQHDHFALPTGCRIRAQATPLPAKQSGRPMASVIVAWSGPGSGSWNCEVPAEDGMAEAMRLCHAIEQWEQIMRDRLRDGPTPDDLQWRLPGPP